MLEAVGKPMGTASATGVTTVQRFTLALNNNFSLSGFGKQRAKTRDGAKRYSNSSSKVENPRLTFNGSTLRYELDDAQGHQEYLEKAQYNRSK